VARIAGASLITGWVMEVEGILTLGGRNPSLDSIRRVLPDRDRLWGDDGRYRPHP
jgi:hypothetical protein